MGKYDQGENMLAELRTMSPEQLNALADTLRQEIIENTSKTGGHLASNLGVVELTIALHRVFRSPEDKIIFDVGHQCYVHKMLTGRRQYMNTLRQHGGLSGFPKRSESVHDMYDSGHSGTSISACLGYAKARDLKHENYCCVAVIGDGALTGGVAWEAMNTAGSLQIPMIVVLNDNEMSISRNVGALAKHLQKLRTSKLYTGFKQSIKDNNSVLVQKLSRVRDAVKYSLLPGILFEELGFKYFGPVDGHNIEEISTVLSVARSINRPAVVHVMTKKGKGFAPAEQNPSKYHGTGKFDPKTADAVEKYNPRAWSSIFGSELTALAEKDSSIVAVTAAMADGTGLTAFRNLYPDRLLDVGIAEQNAVSASAGMALNGLKPVAAIYSTFLQRAFDQIASEICMQNLNVVFAIDRAGVVGADGETHQGVFDIAFLKSLPNMTILSPRDESSLRAALRYALKTEGPAAVRYPRGDAPKAEGRWPETEEISEGVQLLREGSDVLLLSDGSMLCEALSAAEILASKNISAAAAHLMILKPLCEEKLLKLLSGYRYVVCIEDGCRIGGVGEEVAAFASEKCADTRVLTLGWPDKYIEHGSVAELRKIYGMDAASIAEKTGKFIETKA